MIKLLSIELKKVLPYTTAWVFSILYICMVALVFCALPSIHLQSGTGTLSLSKSFFTFPDIWHTLTYIAGFFNLLLGILIIVLITNEYTFRTLRQNIIDGWTVNEFLTAKVLLLLFFAVLATVFVFLFGFIYGAIKSPGFEASDVFSKINFIVAYFVQALAYLCFALFMGTLFKKAGMAIVFYLLYSKIAEPVAGFFLPKSISDYLPFHVISNLINLPGAKLIDPAAIDSPLGIHFVFTLIYSCIFIFISWLLLKKRDN